MSSDKSWYIHTINGKPAFFTGDQICYANRRQNVSILVPNLRTIRAEQARSNAWRRSMGFDSDAGDYSYITFPRKTP